MGRPPTRPVKLRDGFYIEVFSKGSKTGIKLRSDNFEDMIISKENYSKSKKVTVLGEYKNGLPVEQ